MKSILIACPKSESANKLKSFFLGNGFSVYGLCESGQQVLRLAGQMTGGVIICTYRLGDMTACELADRLPVDFDVIVLLKPSQTLDGCWANVLSLPVTARKSELLACVEMLTRTASLTEKKKKTHEPAPRSDEENDTINRAKALLMSCYSMSENDAHRFIQKRSMDSGKKFSETARLILTGM